MHGRKNIERIKFWCFIRVDWIAMFIEMRQKFKLEDLAVVLLRIQSCGM